MAAFQPITLDEAVTRYLTRQANQQAMDLQPALQQFLRWCGRGRPLTDLTPRLIEAFSEASRADSMAQLVPLKGFLKYLHQEGLTAENLAVHAKAQRRGPAAKSGQPAPAPASTKLTPAGYQQALAELETLKRQRVHVAEELQRAMADKDFRENAPLDAAREKQGHLEARIRELEQMLRHAEVVPNGVEQRSGAPRARLGSKVVVKDLAHGDEVTYILVGPREIDPRQGKISIESPTGKALLDRMPGETVSVQAPGGLLQYRVERVEA